MSKSPSTAPSVRHAYQRLWQNWLRPHRARLLLTVVLMVITAVSAAGYAKFMELVIAGYEAGSTSVIWWGPLGIIALTMTKSLSHYVAVILQNRVFSKVQRNLQSKMFQSLLAMDLSHLMAEAPAALAARFSADIELVRVSLSNLFTAITAILTIIATFIVMLSIDWAMTLGLIVIFFLAFGPVGVIGSRVRKIASQTQGEIADMTANVNESLSAVRMVRTYQLEAQIQDGAEGVFARLDKLRVSLIRWQASVSPLMEILGGLAIGMLLFLVALRMQSGAIDISGFIGLLTALGVATTPARRLGAAYASALQGMAALDRIYALFDTPNAIQDGDRKIDGATPIKGALRFEDVGFTYPDGFEALREINLDIEAGKTYAFVGRSGAGKSTIFNLLPRLFDVTAGQITLDGYPISELSLAALRAQISVVSQESILLSGTVGDNIAFGRKGASQEECIAAAKAASAHEFIAALPQGYDTQIDQAGSSFSGGERQRLSIARAILRDAPVLLLDEPTSALDAESEAAIKSALAKLSEGRTTLIIAHRLATIMDADQIVVMDQGAIVEQGTHETLLEADGIYAELYNLQFDISPDAPKRTPRRRAFRNPEAAWRETRLGRLLHFIGV